MAEKPKDEADVTIDMTDPELQCIDFDSACLSIENHVRCWVYSPDNGLCPFLRCNTDHLDTRNAKR